VCVCERERERETERERERERETETDRSVRARPTLEPEVLSPSLLQEVGNWH
jgi:hypothetical protein